MGNWAKSHTLKNAIPSRSNPFGPAQAAVKGLKKDMTPEMPDMSDTPEEKALKSRQMTELAKLDDQENRRIKGILAGRQSTRLVRGARMKGGSRGGSGASPAVSSSAASVAASAAGFIRSGGGGGGSRSSAARM